MKKYFLPVILFFSFCRFSTAQVLCIYCYDQNDTISAGVNNLIVNGGFENGCPNSGRFCPISNFYSCDITNWTCTGGGISTYAGIMDTSIFSKTIIVEGVKASYFGNSYCKACSPIANDTSCIINAGCTVTGIPAGYPINSMIYGGLTGVSLEQTVNGLVTGNTYILEFWAGGEGNSLYFNRSIFGLNIGFGDTLLMDKATPRLGGIGTRYIVEFIATSSSHTIKFTNWGHICSSCTELVLDDVRLYTLAELDASVPHCTVGIDEPVSQSLINISPNPVTNELNVKTNTNDDSEIIFYDLASRKLLQQTFINSVSINTEKFSKGIYLYEVRNKNGVIKKGKVVKE